MGVDSGMVGELVLKIVTAQGVIGTLINRPGLDVTIDDGSECCGDNSSCTWNSPFLIDPQLNSSYPTTEDMGSTIPASGRICQDDGICDYRPFSGVAAPLQFSESLPTQPTVWQICLADANSGFGNTYRIANLTLYVPPVATITNGPYVQVLGRDVTVDGSGSDEDGTVEKFEWDCDGDGVYDFEGTTGDCTLSTAGDFVVNFRVTDNDGRINVASSFITIDSLPVANAGGAYSGLIEEPVTLDASASTESDRLVTYEWDCEDDGTFDKSSASPLAQCVYAASGLYQARLRVTDTYGETDEAVTAIDIDAPSGSASSKLGYFLA
eukprot:TRINITY_DN12480_c0_g1_i1.p1 TRINITY_DN12480_c0_g1~~TRINITY_DN12480_c0_g1_i1.p1  ORF type:complete len:324 (-),score=52.71 TRINITY_DN12480_c0_g1_i1:72-1043(-)